MNKVKLIAEIVVFVVDVGISLYDKVKKAKIFKRKKREHVQETETDQDEPGS